MPASTAARGRVVGAVLVPSWQAAVRRMFAIRRVTKIRHLNRPGLSFWAGGGGALRRSDEHTVGQPFACMLQAGEQAGAGLPGAARAPSAAPGGRAQRFHSFEILGEEMARKLRGD